MIAIRRLAALCALCVGLVAGGVASAGDDARACRAQNDLARLSSSLPRTAQRLADREPLTVVALGSSSTAGAGASSPAAAYPGRLAAALQERFPQSPITVLNRGANGEDAREMLNRFDASVAAEKPDLVLWQVGVNATLRDLAVTPVAALIREGVARMKALGADVILIDSQFAPKVLAKPDHERMLGALAAEARQAKVGLFPRFALMRRWREAQNIPFEAFLSPDGLHMNDWSYACIARLLADAITDAVNHSAASAALTPAPPPLP